jgi:hypothetical protein
MSDKKGGVDIKNNDGGIHLVIGPTTYFFVTISLQIATNGKVINGEDLYPI